jgi:predicted ArsR family transcriptional regulator
MAKQAVTITRDDWQKAIAEITATRIDTDPSVVTLYEFAEMMGVAYQTSRKRLADLVKAGKAVQTRKRVQTQDGRIRSLVAFKLKK